MHTHTQTHMHTRPSGGLSISKASMFTGGGPAAPEFCEFNVSQAENRKLSHHPGANSLVNLNLCFRVGWVSASSLIHETAIQEIGMSVGKFDFDAHWSIPSSWILRSHNFRDTYVLHHSQNILTVDCPVHTSQIASPPQNLLENGFLGEKGILSLQNLHIYQSKRPANIKITNPNRPKSEPYR